MKKKDSAMTPEKRRYYDADFKASALKMIQNGQGVAAVSRALGVGENLLHRWRHMSRQEGPTSADNGELERLRRQVKQLEMERDILKKALSIFSRTS